MTLEKPDIVSVLLNEGIELKQKGKSLWACCPLHSERTPSFKVGPERQSYHCYGCGEHGDAIALIQKLKGLSFRDSLRYLRIVPGQISQETMKESRRRELVKGFREWCDQYQDELCTLYRSLQLVKANAQTNEDVDRLTDIYHAEPLWLHRMDILESGDEQAKFELYREGLNGNYV